METNQAYWDCDCKTNYIHSKAKGNFCTACQTHEENQPDSRCNEVTLLYLPNYDNAIQKDLNLCT